MLSEAATFTWLIDLLQFDFPREISSHLLKPLIQVLRLTIVKVVPAWFLPKGRLLRCAI